MLAFAAVALALVASGCNANTRSDGRVALGLATDKAYLTVLEEQNANAISYSEAILKADPSAQLETFAKNAISAREAEGKEIDKLQSEDSDPAQFTLPNAAEQLGTTLEALGLSADGEPLAAPSTESGYIEAMKANTKGVVEASAPEIDHGSPGVVPFSKQVLATRDDELDSFQDFQ